MDPIVHRPSGCCPRWRLYLVGTVVALVLGSLFAGAWMVYVGIKVSLQAEENLHATLFTIRLVDQFVHDNGRWPQSWAELEQMSFPSDAPSPLNGELAVIRIGGSHGYDWPGRSPHLQERVSIAFDVDAQAIVTTPFMEFNAIKPIGSYYEYRDYGFVESLQESLKKANEERSP